MEKIRLLDNECIQCNSEIDLSIDDFTFFQANKGQHFLYCEKCMPLYEQSKPETHPQIVNKGLPKLEALIIFVLGLAIGIYF